MTEIELIVQADDMGICHAVNEIVVRARLDSPPILYVQRRMFTRRDGP
jgi:hypothetical protein